MPQPKALRQRKGEPSGSANEGTVKVTEKNHKWSAEETRFRSELEVLEKDAGSVRGRDGAVILEDLKALEKKVSSAQLSDGGRTLIISKLEKLVREVEAEDKFEKTCGRVLQLGVMFVTFFPLAVTWLGLARERVYRPTMQLLPDDDYYDYDYPPDRDDPAFSVAAAGGSGGRRRRRRLRLAGRTAVVTGGCGSLGLELATQLATAGAHVVIGCPLGGGGGLVGGFGVKGGGENVSRGLPGGGRGGAQADGTDDEFADFEALGGGGDGGAGGGTDGAGGETGGGDEDQDPAIAAAEAAITTAAERRGRWYAAERRLLRLGLLRGHQEEGAGVAATAAAAGLSDLDRGWVEAWPLELESLAHVRAFALRFLSHDAGGEGGRETRRLDMLVHGAGTKARGCAVTEDGFDAAVQTNFLAPLLLTQLLLPALERGTSGPASADAPTAAGRVVHLGCDAGLALADWLPWPLRRTQPDLLPAMELDTLLLQHHTHDHHHPLTPPHPLRRRPAEAQEAAAEEEEEEEEDDEFAEPSDAAGGGAASPLPSSVFAAGAGSTTATKPQQPSACSPLRRYADSKLLAVAGSVALHRRFAQQAKWRSEEDGGGGGFFDDEEDDAAAAAGAAVTSLALNPGGLDNAFGRSPSSPPPKVSLRAKAMAYLPPVWIAKHVFRGAASALRAAAYLALGPLAEEAAEAEGDAAAAVEGGAGGGSPAAWAARAVRNLLDVQGWFLRPVAHGAAAAFRVATAPALAPDPRAHRAGPAGSTGGGFRIGGGVFADTAGGFTRAGGCPPEVPLAKCGRLGAAQLPPQVLDHALGATLLDRALAALAPFLLDAEAE